MEREHEDQVAELTLEIDEPPRHFECDHCGKAAHHIVGFIYRDGDAYALYRAQVYTRDHLPKAIMAIALDTVDVNEVWTEGISVCLRVDLTQDEYQFGFIEPWEGLAGEEVFVNLLQPDEARRHERRDEFFDVCDFIVETDSLFSQDP